MNVPSRFRSPLFFIPTAQASLILALLACGCATLQPTEVLVEGETRQIGRRRPNIFSDTYYLTEQRVRITHVDGTSTQSKISGVRLKPGHHVLTVACIREESRDWEELELDRPHYQQSQGRERKSGRILERSEVLWTRTIATFEIALTAENTVWHYIIAFDDAGGEPAFVLKRYSYRGFPGHAKPIARFPVRAKGVTE